LCGPDKKTTRLLRRPDRHQIQGANHEKIAWYRSVQTIRVRVLLLFILLAGLVWPAHAQSTANPVLTATRQSFGVIGSTRFPTGDFGSARQIQFALLLQF